MRDANTSGEQLELAVIVPTLNERENVLELIDRLERVLQDLVWEIVVVDDDSQDGTADAVRARAAGDRRIRVLQRVGRRGLSSACIEGMMAEPSRSTSDCGPHEPHPHLPHPTPAKREPPYGKVENANGAFTTFPQGLLATRKELNRSGSYSSKISSKSDGRHRDGPCLLDVYQTRRMKNSAR